MGPVAFAVLAWGAVALVLAAFAYVGYQVLRNR